MKLRSILGKHVEIGEHGCKNCEHYVPEHYGCVLEKCIHGEKNKYVAPKNQKDLCYRCPWGKKTGGVLFCMLPRCIPKLGNFSKGVINDEKKKKNP